MCFKEALAALYVDKKKVKLKEWAGWLYVDSDGLLQYSADSILATTTIKEFVNRTDFYVVEEPVGEVPSWKPLPHIDRVHLDFETRNIDGMACLVKQGYYISFRDIWKLPKQKREESSTQKLNVPNDKPF